MALDDKTQTEFDKAHGLNFHEFLLFVTNIIVHKQDHSSFAARRFKHWHLPLKTSLPHSDQHFVIEIQTPTSQNLQRHTHIHRMPRLTSTLKTNTCTSGEQSQLSSSVHTFFNDHQGFRFRYSALFDKCVEFTRETRLPTHINHVSLTLVARGVTNCA